MELGDHGLEHQAHACAARGMRDAGAQVRPDHATARRSEGDAPSRCLGNGRKRSISAAPLQNTRQTDLVGSLGLKSDRLHRARLGKCRPCTRPSSPSRACRARRAARHCPLGCGRRTRASARRAVGCGRCGRWCGSVEAWFNFLHGCIIRHRCDEMCRFLWAASASLFVAMPNSLAPLQSHRGSP